jgi:hypothetical protein
MRWVMTMAAMLMLAGCATDGAAPPRDRPGAVGAETITYRTQPCFGACPVYTVSVSSDGHGTFTGTRFTVVTGERAFTLSRAEYDRFAALLAPYRPDSGEVRYEMGSDNCGPAPTDMPGAEVSWVGSSQTSRSLHFYFGCSAKNRDLAAALRAAPDALPIADLIGKR